MCFWVSLNPATSVKWITTVVRIDHNNKLQLHDCVRVLLSPASCVESVGAVAAAVRLEGGVGVAAALARGVTTAGEPGPRSIKLSSTEASFNTCTSSHTHTQSLTILYTIHLHIEPVQQNRSAAVQFINFLASTGE